MKNKDSFMAQYWKYLKTMKVYIICLAGAMFLIGFFIVGLEQSEPGCETIREEVCHHTRAVGESGKVIIKLEPGENREVPYSYKDYKIIRVNCNSSEAETAFNRERVRLDHPVVSWGEERFKVMINNNPCSVELKIRTYEIITKCTQHEVIKYKICTDIDNVEVEDNNREEPQGESVPALPVCVGTVEHCDNVLRGADK